MFAGGVVYDMPLTEEHNFLIYIDSIDRQVAKKAKLMHINYPNNPTSASCDLAFFEKIVDLHQKIILLCAMIMLMVIFLQMKTINQ